MELRLSEYNLNTGKFESFLEIGNKNGFAYCGDYIFVNYLEPEHNLGVENYDMYYLKKFKKDQKDPLNRFNGLFNGRTYGEGKFVLSKGYVEQNKSHPQNGRYFWEDDIFRFDYENIKNDDKDYKNNSYAKDVTFILQYGIGKESIRISSHNSNHFDLRHSSYAGFYTSIYPSNDENIMASLIDLPSLRSDNYNRIEYALQRATPANCYLLNRIGNLHENKDLFK